MFGFVLMDNAKLKNYKQSLDNQNKLLRYDYDYQDMNDYIDHLYSEPQKNENRIKELEYKML